MTWASAITGSEVNLVEFFEITCTDATAYRFTMYENDPTFLSNTYSTAPITRDSEQIETGFRVGKTMIRLENSTTVRALIDLDAIQNQRKFDHAEVKIYQVSMTNTANYRMVFNGFVETIEVNRLMTTIRCKDIYYLLKRTFPIRTYSEQCQWKLGSTECGITLTDFRVQSTADSGTTTTIVDAALTEAEGYWARGYVEMTSGTASGEKRSIKSFAAGSDTVTVLVPFTAAIAGGDTFDIYPHCQQTFSLCNSTFSNTDNMLAFFYIPRQDQVN